MTRRALLGGFAMLLAWPACGIDEAFKDPPNKYGPSAFWWWFVGAPYSQEDIGLAIDALQRAGLGGIRITPVYSFPGAVSGGPAYLSPAYLDLVRHAIHVARRAGMVPDTLLGTGWPFGGPYIAPEMGASQIRHSVAEIEGPRGFSGKIPGGESPGDVLIALQAAQTDSSGGIDLDSVVDLTAHASNWRLDHWDVPPGRWVLISFISGKTGMKVKRAAPGGEGLVLDHFRREALDLHLRHNGDVQAPFLEGAHSVTMDSWEVFGANWTPGLPEEFARRRGYRLEPFLAALFYPSGEVGERVRHDFHATVSELALQNFFAPLRDWAHDKRFQTRVEAHGTPADIIEAYGLSDAPEAETYGRQDRPSIKVRDRRLASSSAHLFGRRQVSCETFTWLRYPLFSESLQQMKAAADASYLDGVNQVNYHGVPFSPASASFPGYFFYASTFVSPANTWWPYLPYLSNYLRRSNFMLQQGDPVTDIAVYLPIEDVWSGALGQWYDLAGGIEQRLRANGSLDMIEALQRVGYQFDFINARRIELGAADKYRVVVLPEIEAIEPAVLVKLAEFKQRGGHVVATGRIPSRSPGRTNSASRDSQVRTVASRLFPPDSNALIPRHAAQVLDPGNHPLAGWLRARVSPDLISEELGEVGFVHRRTADEDIYFLANLAAVPTRFRGSFRAGESYPALFDPETGRTAPVFEFSQEGERTRVSLLLEPGKSVFIVFRKEAAPNVDAHNVDRITSLGQSQATAEVSTNGRFLVHAGDQRLHAVVEDLPAPLEIAGPWTLAVPGFGSKQMDSLRAWTTYPESARFSGTASYTAEFSLPRSWLRPDQRLVLEIEGVHEIAEVHLNRALAGVGWKPPFAVDLSNAAAGKNLIEIRVTNLLFNRMLAADDLPPPYVPLKQVRSQPLPSGLAGPVRIKPIRTIRLTP